MICIFTQAFMIIRFLEHAVPQYPSALVVMQDPTKTRIFKFLKTDPTDYHKVESFTGDYIFQLVCE